MSNRQLEKFALLAGLSSIIGCGNSASESGGGGGTTTASGDNRGGSSGSSGSSVGGGALSSGGSVPGGAGNADNGGALGVAGGPQAGAAATESHGGSANGGAAGAGGASAGSAGTAGGSSGTCTASKAANAKATGSGPHEVVVETNSDPGIKEGTIFRPSDLSGSEKYPIFVWGEGGCSLDGLSNSAAMAEIASHGYFVIADGTPNNKSSRTMDASNPAAMGAPLLAYITWATAENEKPCSAYYQKLDPSKIAANGFSCGGLMAEGTAGDPRMTTWGLNSSGLFSANQAFYQTVHTPVLIVLGGSSDIAYQNGERDFSGIGALGQPILLFSKQLGHGGDLFAKNGGDFTKIDLAWLNWRLKGDETATGKGLLVGSACTYCSDSAWEVKSTNLP